MVKNFNSKPIIVSTNFEMGACYDDLNTPICFGGSESPLPGTRPGEYFPGHFSRSFRCLEKNWDTKCTGLCPRIGCYFCTYDDTDLVTL